jgi:hypothetical protein
MARTTWEFSAPLSAFHPEPGACGHYWVIGTGVTAGGRRAGSARQPVTGRFACTGTGVGAGPTEGLGDGVGEGEELGDGDVVSVVVGEGVGDVVPVAVDEGVGDGELVAVEGIGTVTVMGSDCDSVAVLAGAGEAVPPEAAAKPRLSVPASTAPATAPPATHRVTRPALPTLSPPKGLSRSTELKTVHSRHWTQSTELSGHYPIINCRTMALAWRDYSRAYPGQAKLRMLFH